MTYLQKYQYVNVKYPINHRLNNLQGENVILLCS